jgi:uncharacterized protein (DUF2141 family)
MLLTTLSLLLLSHSLEVKITGLHSDKGHVRVLLFTSAQGWPADDAKALRREVISSSGGVATLTFHDLPAGSFAVVAFHDEDDDGKLAKNLFGAPTEGWGASNDARALLGPPWEASRFELRADRSISFSIRY